MTIQWTQHSGGYHEAIVTLSEVQAGVRVFGQVRLLIQPRPYYCDRGDWTLNVHALNTVAGSMFDAADGFPRMFFGSLEEAKEQFNRWSIKRREDIANYTLDSSAW